MNKNWRGIMKILEIQHIRNHSIVWQEKNINNLLHSSGELFFLNCCFQTYEGFAPPLNYYLGLDNRSTVALDDTLASLVDEPINTNNYSRKAVSSSNGFTIEQVSGVYRATSQIVSFNAAGGSWGPVSKIFLTTSPSDDIGGSLLATASLTSNVTLNDGDTINMRMALSLQDY